MRCCPDKELGAQVMTQLASKEAGLIMEARRPGGGGGHLELLAVGVDRAMAAGDNPARVRGGTGNARDCRPHVMWCAAVCKTARYPHVPARATRSHTHAVREGLS